MGIESFLNQDFTLSKILKSGKTESELNNKKQTLGMQAKRQGDIFEDYFKSILKVLEEEKAESVIAFRKHSNEVVGILAKRKMFGLIKKLGHKKGDLDFSITLKCGYTVFAECKSGDSPLSKEQKDLIEIYISNKVPFFIFCEKPIKKYIDYCVIATRNFALDKQNIRNILALGSY